MYGENTKTIAIPIYKVSSSYTLVLLHHGIINMHMSKMLLDVVIYSWKQVVESFLSHDLRSPVDNIPYILLLISGEMRE